MFLCFFVLLTYLRTKLSNTYRELASTSPGLVTFVGKEKQNKECSTKERKDITTKEETKKRKEQKRKEEEKKRKENMGKGVKEG